MIPVDNKWALGRKPYPWIMPFDPLYADLLKRTGSRIVRSDDGIVTPGRRNKSWREFESRVTVDPQYIEVVVPDDP